MENASKALIIAGAILLSILIISLGIMIFNQAQDAMGNGGMSDAEVTAFNNKFIKYEGEQKGSALKNLIQEVNVNNAQDSDKFIQMEIQYTSATRAPSTNPPTTVAAPNDMITYATSQIVNTHTYHIKVDTSSTNNGRVNSIRVFYEKPTT